LYLFISTRMRLS